MDEYSDIYYVDERNASRDHRTQGSGASRPVYRPVRTVQPAVATTAPAVYRPAYAPAPAPVLYPGGVMYGDPSQWTAGSLLGRLTMPQILEIAAAAFAALQSLPAAPTAAKDVDTNVQNLITYQAALAAHAKRDEQLRTLGSLIAKLAG